ncbi:MAG: hypothetical protein RLY40_578 [Pseudomonadota bacterium]|jgi:hypothetical protein
MINPPDKAISYGFVLQAREIGIALQNGLSEEELRSTLLSQIHHVTVYEINRYKLQDAAKTKTILEYPFLNEQGAIDNSLRAELSFAIGELSNNVKEFFSLAANKYRNPVAEKRLTRYLEAIKDYQPMVYRVQSHISDREVDVIELENDIGTLYRNNRPIVHQGAGEIQLLCSANKDKSPLELARAFFYDYSRAYKNLKASLVSRDKNIAAAEYLIHNKFLVEFSSAIDAMLTPKMKQVFAKRFDRYFDNYAKTYVSGLAEENITDLLQTRYSA